MLCLFLIPAGSPGTVCPYTLGTWVQVQGETYQVVADVSQFDPPDIVVTTSNGHVAIWAEKVRTPSSLPRYHHLYLANWEAACCPPTTHDHLMPLCPAGGRGRHGVRHFHPPVPAA